jgi:glycosyltransferase involved in cell wall biosynthesis
MLKTRAAGTPVPLSVLIACKNEATNLAYCLPPLKGWCDEVIIVDSRSSDKTCDIAQVHNATVVQFDYKGGWPKKRQWALDSYPFRNDWILIIDADEIVTEPLKKEIELAILDSSLSGCYIRTQMHFLGKHLRFGDTQLWKLSLFKKGRGKYECRLAEQDSSMADMEIHEHLMVDGRIRRLRASIRHCNVRSLYDYIEKQNAYSNWGSALFFAELQTTLRPTLFGNQAQRRRWVKAIFGRWLISPIFLFIYMYVVRLGFLDGSAGFIYAGLISIQNFYVQIKIRERQTQRHTT